VMVFRPIVTDEQHRSYSFQPRDNVSSAEETPRSNGQVLTQDKGHDIPAAVTSPHDQRAHGLPQDLTSDQMIGVLTRQPLPTPTLPKPAGKSH